MAAAKPVAERHSSSSPIAHRIPLRKRSRSTSRATNRQAKVLMVRGKLVAEQASRDAF